MKRWIEGPTSTLGFGGRTGAFSGRGPAYTVGDEVVVKVGGKERKGIVASVHLDHSWVPGQTLRWLAILVFPPKPRPTLRSVPLSRPRP